MMGISERRLASDKPLQYSWWLFLPMNEIAQKWSPFHDRFCNSSAVFLWITCNSPRCRARQICSWLLSASLWGKTKVLKMSNAMQGFKPSASKSKSCGLKSSRPVKASSFTRQTPGMESGRLNLHSFTWLAVSANCRTNCRSGVKKGSTGWSSGDSSSDSMLLRSTTLVSLRSFELELAVGLALAFDGEGLGFAIPVEDWELLGLFDCVVSATFHQTPKKDATHSHHWCCSANRISLLAFLFADLPPRGAPGVRGVVPKSKTMAQAKGDMEYVRWIWKWKCM